MRFDQYRLRSRWHLPAPVNDVAKLIRNVADLPRWLPQARYAEELPREGEWRHFHLHLRGFLPHTVKLNILAREREEGRKLEVVATGDLEGNGEWTLTNEPSGTSLELVQELRARAPILRLASLLMKPICIANHNWIMRHVGERMGLELARTKNISRTMKTAGG